MAPEVGKELEGRLAANRYMEVVLNGLLQFVDHLQVRAQQASLELVGDAPEAGRIHGDGTPTSCARS